MNKIYNVFTKNTYNIEYDKNIQVVTFNNIEDALILINQDLTSKQVVNYVVITDVVDISPFEKVVMSNNIIVINNFIDNNKLKKQINWILNNFNKDNLMSDKNIFFTSDQHFYHANIIKYCNRPWHSDINNISQEDVMNMNKTMIENWNKVVRVSDIVWCLGDFCLGPNQSENIPNLVSKLNGKINLVLGNHDHHSVKFYYDAGFNRVYDRSVIIKDFIVLSHAPMNFIKEPFFNIYGHVHDCQTYKTFSKESCCVCVERHNYAPISLNEIRKNCFSENEQ